MSSAYAAVELAGEDGGGYLSNYSALKSAAQSMTSSLQSDPAYKNSTNPLIMSAASPSGLSPISALAVTRLPEFQNKFNPNTLKQSRSISDLANSLIATNGPSEAASSGSPDLVTDGVQGHAETVRDQTNKLISDLSSAGITPNDPSKFVDQSLNNGLLDQLAKAGSPGEKATIVQNALANSGGFTAQNGVDVSSALNHAVNDFQPDLQAYASSEGIPTPALPASSPDLQLAQQQSPSQALDDMTRIPLVPTLQPEEDPGDAPVSPVASDSSPNNTSTPSGQRSPASFGMAVPAQNLPEDASSSSDPQSSSSGSSSTPANPIVTNLGVPATPAAAPSFSHGSPDGGHSSGPTVAQNSSPDYSSAPATTPPSAASNSTNPSDLQNKLNDLTNNGAGSTPEANALRNQLSQLPTAGSAPVSGNSPYNQGLTGGSPLSSVLPTVMNQVNGSILSGGGQSSGGPTKCQSFQVSADGSLPPNEASKALSFLKGFESIGTQAASENPGFIKIGLSNVLAKLNQASQGNPHSNDLQIIESRFAEIKNAGPKFCDPNDLSAYRNYTIQKLQGAPQKMIDAYDLILNSPAKLRAMQEQTCDWVKLKAFYSNDAAKINGQNARTFANQFLNAKSAGKPVCESTNQYAQFLDKLFDALTPYAAKCGNVVGEMMMNPDLKAKAFEIRDNTSSSSELVQFSTMFSNYVSTAPTQNPYADISPNSSGLTQLMGSLNNPSVSQLIHNCDNLTSTYAVLQEMLLGTESTAGPKPKWQGDSNLPTLASQDAQGQVLGAGAAASGSISGGHVNNSGGSSYSSGNGDSNTEPQVSTAAYGQVLKQSK